jgi:hypothetical protein
MNHPSDLISHVLKYIKEYATALSVIFALFGALASVLATRRHRASIELSDSLQIEKEAETPLAKGWKTRDFASPSLVA